MLRKLNFEQKAEELPAFSGLKLIQIKRQLAEVLGLIGRNGVFDEYTKHDISHVDEMLSTGLAYSRRHQNCHEFC